MMQIPRPMYFDRKGNPLTCLDWGDKFSDREYQVVKQETIGKYLISTVWVGLNMNMFRDGPPLIFETMIFFEQAGNKNELCGYQERYSTEEEALIGHEKAKEELLLEIEKIPQDF